MIAFGKIPEIETPRLKLRAHKLEDLPFAIKMWMDPLVTRYTTGVASNEQRTWTRLTSYLGHWALLGFGYWAVEEKACGHYIGELGFADFRREITPSIVGIPELGWGLDPAFHGKGYATEALSAALSWGEKNLNAKKTVCIIHPDNKASLRVAEKLGYQEVQKTTYNNEPSILFQKLLA